MSAYDPKRTLTGYPQRVRAPDRIVSQEVPKGPGWIIAVYYRQGQMEQIS